MLFHTVSETESGSLSYMVSKLQSDFGISINKQSLNERFNAKSVFFVKEVLREVLREQFSNLYFPELLPNFSRILIKDSTKMLVPPGLESKYRACGGDVHSRSKAGISIQYEYDLKSGGITDLTITSGDRNDRTDAGETACKIEKNTLIIRDLGYFSTPVYEACSEKESFFLSRLDCSTNVYDETGKLISFSNIYRAMQKSREVEKELFVYVGKQTKLPVRLILQKVPDEIYEKRIREKTKKSKGQGRGQLTEETKIRCRFNLFITNAEESMLSANRVYPLYRIRWQIELQFKIWKSVFKIDGWHEMKEARYFTLLYIKLILIIMNLQIVYSLQQSIVQNKADKIQVLSLNKSLKTLKTLFDEIFMMLRGTVRKAKEMTKYIRSRLLENHQLESKKKKLCLPEILTLFICISGK